MKPELNPCPFCGGRAYLARTGTPKQSSIVECESCGCCLETGEEGDQCGDAWNRRATAEPVKVRKAFICATCEGVYPDHPVSQCDCMPEKDEFIEGTIAYSSAEPMKMPNDAEMVLLDYAMAVAHERELCALGHKHDSDGAVARFRSAVRRALLAKCSEQPVQCSEVKGYDAADMASQGAQGFRDGYAAALEDAIAQCNALDNNENSERYRAGALWCVERIRALKSGQQKP